MRFLKVVPLKGCLNFWYDAWLSPDILVNGCSRTSCLSSWLSILRRSSVLISSPSFRLLCRSSLMYSQALDKIPPLLWNRSVRVRLFPSLSCLWDIAGPSEPGTHLSRLGVVNVTVWDGLRQLHDPVVNLVPASALNCWDRI